MAGKAAASPPMTETRPSQPAEGPSAVCARCSVALRPRRSFAFKAPVIGSYLPPGATPAQLTKCLRCAFLHRPLIKRSFIAGLVVGTILTALNQGDALLNGQWNNALYWKIPLTYCVPFIVATYGALTNSRQ